MAEENTVTMTVENIDRLFSEIVVNGESHVSENYVPPVQLEQSVTQTVEEEEEPSTPAQAVQGQDVYAVDLNNVLHDFVDPEVAQGLADEIQTRRNADTALQNSINTINSKIPSQASAENQLADKNFVNSSIATNTANFLGTYTTLQEIEAIPNPTNNDYAFLATTDSAGNTLYDRYKYSAEDEQWLFEYELNNSGFTAEQWATINSGLTQQSVDEDIQEAISQVGSGIEVYDTEEEMEEDLPNKQDDDLVGTLSSDDGELQDAPLGSVTSYLGDTDPSDGKWLICDGRDTTGTAIELETHYPSLYMFLGGTNVLPEIFDHSRPSAIENVNGDSGFTLTTTNSVAPYDGIITFGYSSSHYKTLYVNNVARSMSGNSGGINTTSYEIKKGDLVRVDIALQLNDTINNVIWFKKHKIIKAVSSVDTYNIPSSEIAQIEQYFDEGQQRAQSYSTTETLTSGKWIDGKPIYRKVFDNGSWATSLDFDASSLNIETLIKTDVIGSDSSGGNGNRWLINSVVNNGIIYFQTSNQHIIVRNENTYKRYAIIEYTKTTD